MIPGLDTAAAGMKVRMDQQDVIAANLANVNTPGYHRKVSGFSTFQSILQINQSQADTSSTLPALVVAEDSRPGTMLQTGAPSDIALEGPGFLVLKNDTGEELVRGGSFHLDAASRLVNAAGLPVQGEGGTITIPSKEWTVDDDGNVTSGDTIVDKLLVRKDPSADPKAVARVLSGSVEGSNVNTIQEMVSMITALREYESCQKVIQSIDQTLDKVINQMQK